MNTNTCSQVYKLLVTRCRQLMMLALAVPNSQVIIYLITV